MNLLTVVMILVTCSLNVWSEDIARGGVSTRLQLGQKIERLENARLMAQQALPAAIIRAANPVVQDNGAVMHHVALQNVIHHIDHIVYGTSVLYGQQQIENQLGNKVQQLSSEYDLTEAQRSKLMLATQWEAKQFSNEVDSLRRKYQEMRNDLIGQQVVLSQAQALQKKRRTLFGPDSFSSKVMAKTVTGDQLSKYQAVLDERLRLRHRSNIEGAIRDIERQVVLKIAQHEALVDLLLAEVLPPKSNHDYDEAVVKYQFSRIPEQKLRPVFEENQWPLVKPILDGFQELETTLAQQGLIEIEGAESSNTATTPQQNKLPTDATPIIRNRAQQEGKKP